MKILPILAKNSWKPEIKLLPQCATPGENQSQPQKKLQPTANPTRQRHGHDLESPCMKMNLTKSYSRINEIQPLFHLSAQAG